MSGLKDLMITFSRIAEHLTFSSSMETGVLFFQPVFIGAFLQFFFVSVPLII